MTLDKICMRIKRVGMEVLSILVFFSSPTNSSRMSDLKPATLRHGEREANSGSNGRETSSFLLLPVFWLFFFFTNGFRWKDAQRRRRSMGTRKAILPHRSRNHSRSVSFHIQYPPSLWSALPTHTHNYGTVSSPAVGFSVWNFLPTQKISTWVHFRVKMQDLQTKKSSILTGER